MRNEVCEYITYEFRDYRKLIVKAIKVSLIEILDEVSRVEPYKKVGIQMKLV